MSEDRITDLKQFIVSTVSQSEMRLEAKISLEINSLRREMMGGLAGIGQTFEVVLDLITELDDKVNKIDKRLFVLEQRSCLTAP